MYPFAAIGITILGCLGSPGAIQLQRFGSAGSYNATTGFWTPTNPTVSTPMAVVNPSVQSEVMLLPENERSKDAITVYTLLPLLMSNVSTGQQADQIVWQGRTYRVMISDDWSNQAQYCRAIATRIGE